METHLVSTQNSCCLDQPHSDRKLDHRTLSGTWRTMSVFYSVDPIRVDLKYFSSSLLSSPKRLTSLFGLFVCFSPLFLLFIFCQMQITSETHFNNSHSTVGSAGRTWMCSRKPARSTRARRSRDLCSFSTAKMMMSNSKLASAV